MASEPSVYFLDAVNGLGASFRPKPHLARTVARGLELGWIEASGEGYALTSAGAVEYARLLLGLAAVQRAEFAVRARKPRPCPACDGTGDLLDCIHIE
jgi:hypothetical protein